MNSPINLLIIAVGWLLIQEIKYIMNKEIEAIEFIEQQLSKSLDKQLGFHHLCKSGILFCELLNHIGPGSIPTVSHKDIALLQVFILFETCYIFSAYKLKLIRYLV